MISTCAARKNMPEIIGGDATARFFSERGNREIADFTKVPVSYVAMGAELVLTGRRCLERSDDGFVSNNDKVIQFCSQYRTLQAKLDDHFTHSVFNPFPAARTGLAYDGAKLLLNAVLDLDPDPSLVDSGAPTFSHPGLVLKLTETTYQGVTGEISFADSHIAKKQTMAILKFENVRDVKSSPKCIEAVGVFQGGETDTGCPQS
jgi:hypothetical protein